MARELDLLVLGDAKPDLIVSVGRIAGFEEGERLVERSALTLGGSGGIAACGAAALGLRVAFAGVVGDDAFGRFVVEALEAHGVDTSGVVVESESSTGVSLVLKREDQETVLTDVGTVAALHEDQVDRELLSACHHVHVASLYLQEALRPGLHELFEEAHRAGASTSIDPNRDPTGNWDGGMFDLLSATDILFANSVEVRAITGVDDVDVAAEALAERGAVVREVRAGRRPRDVGRPGGALGGDPDRRGGNHGRGRDLRGGVRRRAPSRMVARAMPRPRRDVRVAVDPGGRRDGGAAHDGGGCRRAPGHVVTHLAPAIGDGLPEDRDSDR
jgi:sugar/nucleoside kinase (ribokinase family)